MSKYDLFGLTTSASHTPCNTGIRGLSLLYYVALSTMLQVRGFFQMLQKPTQPHTTNVVCQEHKDINVGFSKIWVWSRAFRQPSTPERINQRRLRNYKPFILCTIYKRHEDTTLINIASDSKRQPAVVSRTTREHLTGWCHATRQATTQSINELQVTRLVSFILHLHFKGNWKSFDHVYTIYLQIKGVWWTYYKISNTYTF